MPRAPHPPTHRRTPRPRRAVDALARVGSAVSLASLVVLGIAVAAAEVDSARPATLTVTFDDP